jgi:hypothetical protein
MKTSYAFAFLIFCVSTCAQEKTAHLRGFCDSVMLMPVQRYLPGVGDTITYFTTYDADPNQVTHFEVRDNVFYFSGEMKPRGAGDRISVADYAIFLLQSGRLGSVLQHGWVEVTTDFEDTNGNGVADMVERALPASKTFPITSYARFPSASQATGTLSLNRAAGSASGTYTATYPGSGQTVSGVWHLGFLDADVQYTRMPNQISFSTALIGSGGAITTVSGSTTFIVASRSELRASSISLVLNGKEISANLSSLVLNNHFYRGMGTLSDGWTTTKLPDFTNWHFEIEDANDSDANGIPDLSDSQYVQAAKIDRITRDGRSGIIDISSPTPCKLAFEFSTDLKGWRQEATRDVQTTRTNYSFSTIASDHGFYRIRSIPQY